MGIVLAVMVRNYLFVAHVKDMENINVPIVEEKKKLFAAVVKDKRVLFVQHAKELVKRMMVTIVITAMV